MLLSLLLHSEHVRLYRLQTLPCASNNVKREACFGTTSWKSTHLCKTQTHSKTRVERGSPSLDVLATSVRGLRARNTNCGVLWSREDIYSHRTFGNVFTQLCRFALDIGLKCYCMWAGSPVHTRTDHGTCDNFPGWVPGSCTVVCVVRYRSMRFPLPLSIVQCVVRSRMRVCGLSEGLWLICTHLR